MAPVGGLLKAYLQLEKLVLELDETDEARADALRDMMDPLWYRLSAEEQAWLRDRGGFDRVLALHGLGTRPLTVIEPDPAGGTRLVLDAA